jgi:hypothetical protein
MGIRFYQRDAFGTGFSGYSLEGTVATEAEPQPNLGKAWMIKKNTKFFMVAEIN